MTTSVDEPRSVVRNGFARRVAPGAIVVGVGLAVLAGAFGSFRLGTKSLWHDEAFTVSITELPLGETWSAIVHGDPFNGLYYLLIHPWLALGDGEAWVRAPSVVFGLGAAVALFVLVRRLFDRTTATVATVLLIANSFFVQYMQEARPYSLALLLVVVSTLLFVVALDRPSLPMWGAYAIVVAVAIYAHLFAGLLVPAHIASLALRRPRPPLRPLVAAYALVAVAVSPLVVVAARAENLQRAFVSRPTFGSFEWLFLTLTGGGGVETRTSRLLLTASFVACVVALVAWIRMLLRDRRVASSSAWSFGLIVSWLVVPVVLAFAISFVATPIFFPRYLIAALPALSVFVALGIRSLGARWAQAVGFVVVIALSTPPLTSYYAAGFKEGQDWERAVSFVTGRDEPGDGVVFLSRYGRRPFWYYLRRTPDQAILDPVYPSMPWGSYRPVFADLNIEPTSAAAERLPDLERVWVVLVWRGFGSINEDAEPFRRVLTDEFVVATSRRFGPALAVQLYEHRP
jgi:mannosyltransferase